MSENLRTYLQDHLAGARFAVSLLNDLAKQETDEDVAALALTLIGEIEADKQVVEEILLALDESRSILKEATAWLAQKVGRAKFQLERSRFSIFEALEILSLGILGKLALWSALDAIALSEKWLQSYDFVKLAETAKRQHAQVEQQRLLHSTSLCET